MGNRFDLLNDVQEILFEDASCFEPYPNEKIRMKLHTGEKYEQLKESIKKNGILTPIIAMPSKNRGMLTTISGLNRINIAKELDIQVPYQLRTDLTQEQADLICIDTNLLNRQVSEYLYSELGFILKTKYDIIKNQGKRNDLNEETSRNDCTKLLDDYKLSKRSIQNYIRLTFLDDNLLKMVDEKEIQFVSGISLSYLKANEQSQLYELLINKQYKINPVIAEELKKLSQSTENIIDIQAELNKLLQPKNTTTQIKIHKKTLTKIKEIIPQDQIENLDSILVNALKLYYEIKE